MAPSILASYPLAILKNHYLCLDTRTLAFILGVSLWLTVGEAKALAGSNQSVSVVVTTTSVSKSKQTLKE